MPVLDNPRHELFAQALASGKSATEAYTAAGYTDNDGNASRLKGNERIAARVTEILEKAAERVEINAANVLAELGKMAFSNMLDYAKVNSDGSMSADFTSLTRDQAAAIQEITTETRHERDGDDTIPVTKTKFKLADKRGNLELLGKHLGLFKDRFELTGRDGGAIEVNDTEAARRIAAMLLGATK